MYFYLPVLGPSKLMLKLPYVSRFFSFVLTAQLLPLPLVGNTLIDPMRRRIMTLSESTPYVMSP